MTQSDSSTSSINQRLRWLWNESLERHVVVHKQGRRIVDLPLLLVLIAAALAPWLVALGIVIGLLKSFTFGMEHQGKPTDVIFDANPGGDGTGAPSQSSESAPDDTAPAAAADPFPADAAQSEAIASEVLEDGEAEPKQD